MRHSWPLTGRDEEMRVVEAAISDPELAGIVICGAAGVGKSRVAREALRSAASNGCESRWVVGTSAARNIPLGAFASWAPVVTAETLHVVRSVIDALTSAPEGTTVVIGVDDAQLLDDLSTFVLHQIVERRIAKLVLTVRDRDPVPDGTRELWAAASFDRLDLQPLSCEDTAELLSATLCGRMDQESASRMWRLTGGNALYLRNIVEQEVADGRLVQQRGCWRWIDEPVVPSGLVDMIESRIGTLPTAVSDVLDAVAVSEPVELAALVRITDPAAIEEADIRGLISVERVDGRPAVVRAAHPLYAEVRRKRAAPTRLRRMRGLLAAELANRDGVHDMRAVVRRATLSIDSDLTPDPNLLLRAAFGAMWLTDPALTDRLAEAAISAGAGELANLVRAHTLSWLGRRDEARAVLASCATERSSDADEGGLTFMRAITMMWVLEDPTSAKQLVDDARHTASPESRGCLDAFLAVYWAAMGYPDAVLKSPSKNLTLDQLPDLVGAEVAWAITAAAGDAGRTNQAVEAAAAGHRFLTRSLGAPPMALAIADAHVGALLLSGRVGEASRAAERQREQAADLPGAARLLSNLVTGRAALGAGRLDTACSLLEPVAEMLPATSQAGAVGGAWYKCLIAHTVALGIRGAADEAAAARERLERHCHPGWQRVDHERALAHAWTAAAQGALGQAIAAVLAGAQIARERGQFAAEVICLQTAAQFGDSSSAPRLRDLSGLVEGPRVGLAARFAAALRAADAGELEAVSREFERIGDLIAAVDATAHAVVVHRREGSRGSAYGCAARAEALAQQCGGADTPALRNAIMPLPLSAREREVVMMLAEGLTNRAIAERLGVTVRTAETHIYRAMSKTGAIDRDQLAALLPRHQYPPTD